MRKVIKIIQILVSFYNKCLAKNYVLTFQDAFVLLLQPSHHYIPHGYDVANRACKHKEVEHGVHKTLLAQAVEGGTSDVSHTLGYNPY